MKKEDNKEKNENKKNLIITIGIVLVIILIGIGIGCLLINGRDLLNTNHQMSKINCNSLDGFELDKCLKENIENNNNYTKEELITIGYNEVNIENIDLNTNLEIDSSNLHKVEHLNKVEILFSTGENLVVELNGNNINLNVYNSENEVIKTQKIDNIKAMYYYKWGGVSTYRYIFLVDNDDKLFQLKTRSDTYLSNEENIEFKELKTSYKYVDLYTIYMYGTTSGEVMTYLGETEDGTLRFINNENIYNEDTYKVVNDKVVIINNRDIYLDSKLQSFKLKLEFDDFVLANKVDYILSNENYLYDDDLQLLYNGKVSSILGMDSNSTVIVIFEDGKNMLLDTVKII